jgi:hypothetical protein
MKTCNLISRIKDAYPIVQMHTSFECTFTAQKQAWERTVNPEAFQNLQLLYYNCETRQKGTIWEQ